MDRVFRVRSDQLMKEKIIDEKLNKLPCISTVNRYLMMCREINRKSTLHITSGSWNLYKIYNDIAEDLETKERFYKNIEEILQLDSDDKICQSLNDYLSLMNN